MTTDIVVIYTTRFSPDYQQLFWIIMHIKFKFTSAHVKFNLVINALASEQGPGTYKYNKRKIVSYMMKNIKSSILALQADRKEVNTLLPLPYAIGKYK